MPSKELSAALCISDRRVTSMKGEALICFMGNDSSPTLRYCFQESQVKQDERVQVIRLSLRFQPELEHFLAAFSPQPLFSREVLQPLIIIMASSGLALTAPSNGTFHFASPVSAPSHTSQPYLSGFCCVGFYPCSTLPPPSKLFKALK